MRQTKIKNIVLYGLFIAIEMMLILVPFLGYIPIGPLRATTLHIPVIIAGIVLGPVGGSLIGLVFGLSSLWYNTINPTITSFVFSPFISGNLWSAWIALIPRILIGYVSGMLYLKLKKGHKNNTLAMIISSLIGSFTNTILVLGGIYLIFKGSYASALQMDVNDLLPYLLGIIFTSSMLEAIIGTIISVMVSKSLFMIKK